MDLQSKILPCREKYKSEEKILKRYRGKERDQMMKRKDRNSRNKKIIRKVSFFLHSSCKVPSSLLRLREDDVVLVDRLMLGAANLGDSAELLLWTLSLLLSSFDKSSGIALAADQPMPLIRRSALAHPLLEVLVEDCGLSGSLAAIELWRRTLRSVADIFKFSLWSVTVSLLPPPFQYEIVRRRWRLLELLPSRVLDNVLVGAGPGPGAGGVDLRCCCEDDWFDKSGCVFAGFGWSMLNTSSSCLLLMIFIRILFMYSCNALFVSWSILFSSDSSDIHSLANCDTTHRWYTFAHT